MPAKAGTQNSKRHVWLTAYVPLIVWTIVMLGLGSGVGAANETSQFIRPLLEFVFPAAAPETLAVYHGYIRKLAHVVEYALLAVLAARVFAGSKWRFALSLAFVIAVAVADEVNQGFNPARTSSPWDVLLDTAGGAAALLFYRMATRSDRRRPASVAVL